MDAYIFQAAYICPKCAEAVMAVTEESQNSDWYPQGPIPDGGGEADCPQSCDICFVELDNTVIGAEN